ncbi:MAG: peptide-methionine (S)-S-oxide reductase MsrA [Bacteroidales bacterium]|nr:peptide-methionine (S)-S-oxide reductase MsrA [Bacteroidales bacterium]
MTKTIYLAGGCFWGAEHFLRKIKGVKDTCTGFANGNTVSPTYKEVYTDTTGFAETVKVDYDPVDLPLELLIALYFKSIDPLSVNRQGHDEGTRYRTGIYYTDDAEKTPIMRVYRKVESETGSPLAVEVEPLKNFYSAEEYHQDYLIKNPDGYCHLPLEMFSYASKANRTEVYLRKAEKRDLDAVSLIMTQAVDQMLREGKKQWDRTYPLPSDILADMERGVGMVLCRKAGPFPGEDSLRPEEILSYAAVVFDGEKAYDSIEGQWISDLPYVVVHRIAVSDDYKKMGVASRMMEMIGEFALGKGFPSFRIDTTYDNFYMQKMLSNLGFTYTGKCFYPKGERLCYEKITSR